MKIFSWIHRRFHQKDGGSQDFKKGDHNEKVALLEKEDLGSACDGWKEGILVIGTFGIDLFKDLNPKDDGNQVLFFGDHEDQEEEKEEDQEGEMECPLVLKASNHGFDQKQDPDEAAKPNNGGGYVKDSVDLDMEILKKIKKRGERITLADLLWADSENNLLKNNKLSDDDHHNKVIKVPTVSSESIKKHDAHDDDHDGCLISKKKKKLPKDDSADHPIKKTKRLMRKMLKKKKIHPDIGIQKMETADFIYQQMDHVHAT
ncbi:uncharacterized protein LOC112523523 isoform X1 [Cynara cardunculus var. scolymus]|uniref:uncharacterized protein LOC112523523 isoform X1 n=1 Tax=Cynara cardunculus var. scolymus TaxID=59895 RepID=UPI000D62735F|nr:uncharacterized protein LOC112523523 isoform X1 [Cynara cardunculus var. scolymus]